MEDDTDDVDNVSVTLEMEDETSESSSPSLLFPVPEVNLEFNEKTNEDPYHLNLNLLHHNCKTAHLHEIFVFCCHLIWCYFIIQMSRTRR